MMPIGTLFFGCSDPLHGFEYPQILLLYLLILCFPPPLGTIDKQDNLRLDLVPIFLFRGLLKLKVGFSNTTKRKPSQTLVYGMDGRYGCTYITSSYKHRVTIQQLVEVTTIHKYKRIITLQHDSATKDLIDLSSINTMYPSRIRIHGTSIHHPPPNNKWYAYAY